jgi:hypothetical protein
MTHTHTFSILPVSPGTFEEIRSKLKAAGYDHALFEDGIDMHGIAIKIDDGSYMPTTPPIKRKHSLKFVADKGLLADALGLPRDQCAEIEKVVEQAISENRNARWLFETVGAMEITDEMWANFLYTYGWWDGRRRL